MLGGGVNRLRMQGWPQWHGEAEPCFRGDRILCRGVLPLWSATSVRYRIEPAMRCYAALCRERCVQCSLPCVNRSGKRSDASGLMALRSGRYLFERLFAKEDRNRKKPLWKAPRLSVWADMGLRYGLSGNRVSAVETGRLTHERETT